MIFDWVAVAAGCLPYYFLYVDCEIGDRHSKTILEWDVCLLSWNRYPWYVFYQLFDFVMSYALPVVVSSVLYVKMLRALCPRRNAMLRSASGYADTSASVTPSDSQKSTRSDASISSRKAVVKMLGVCILVFFVCYTPMAVFHLYALATHRREPFSYLVIFFVCSFLQIASTINPFIYTIYSRAFRRRISALLTCRWRPNCTRRTSVSTEIKASQPSSRSGTSS
ncbi:Protein NPR-15 [Aphelenchoides avenae]|nr:Protein NPR-15 [Aphelenchus avenae]